MAEYFSVLISAAALSSLAALLAYRGGERFTKFAVALILFYSIAQPTVAALSELYETDFEDFSDIELPALSDSAYFEAGEEGFALGIERLIADRYGILKDDVSVSVFGFSPEKMQAEQIEVSLSGEGLSLDYRELRNYIESSGLGSCSVNYLR